MAIVYFFVKIKVKRRFLTCILWVDILLACISVYHMYEEAIGARRGVGPSGTGVL